LAWGPALPPLTLTATKRAEVLAEHLKSSPEDDLLNERIQEKHQCTTRLNR
jgi:hypothetical protein